MTSPKADNDLLMAAASFNCWPSAPDRSTLSEAATTVAQAEKNANQALKKKRELDIDEKRLDVYQALASNKQVVVTDATDAESARLLVSDAVLQQHGGQQSSEAALVAKMNVLRVASNALGMRSEWDQSKLDGIKPQTMGR